LAERKRRKTSVIRREIGYCQWTVLKGVKSPKLHRPVEGEGTHISYPNRIVIDGEKNILVRKIITVDEELEIRISNHA